MTGNLSLARRRTMLYKSHFVEGGYNKAKGDMVYFPQSEVTIWFKLTAKKSQ